MDAWRNCPRCQERLRTEGLRNPYELQSYFIRRIEKIVNAHQRTLIGWDVSALTGGAGNYGPALLPPTTNAPNLTTTGLMRGSGVVTNGTQAAAQPPASASAPVPVQQDSSEA